MSGRILDASASLTPLTPLIKGECVSPEDIKTEVS